MITVFTPTYNRARLLPRLYNSLTKQSYKNFEWLIVDDGSTDNTECVVNEFIARNDNLFKIRYYKIENGGKHRAINYGVLKAQGEAFFIVDSDDWLPENSLGDIFCYFNQVKDNLDFGGVAGLKQSIDPNFNEKTFEGEYLDATSLERKKYGIIGEKAEVFKTSILKEFPFPEYEGEKFISEAVVWNKIAANGYKLRWFNKCVYKYEYQADGLTNNLSKKYMQSPIGYLTYIKQEIVFNKESFIRKYILYGRCLKNIKGSKLRSSEVKKILGISLVQMYFSKFVWLAYSLVKGRKD